MVGLFQHTPAGRPSFCYRASSPAVHTAGGLAAPQHLSQRRVVCHGTIPGSNNNAYNGITSWTNSEKARQIENAPAQLGSESKQQHTEASNQNSGALQKADFPKFVQFFRQASPYIAGHRARTFIIVVPGNVTGNRQLLQSTMSDIALLHGLGVRLVVVSGCQHQIDAMLQERGMKPAYVGGYRVTDKDALKISVEAAGQVRTMCEQYLSKGPAIPMIRRHTKGDGEIHFEPAMRVVSGNYVTAKRRGVVDGVDFGYTGEVRFVLKDDIQRQLEGGNVVLLSNLGFTAAGEVLNCNTYDVGLHAAVELGADKLFFLHLDEVTHLQLPHWLPLSEAQNMLIKRLQDFLSGEQMDVLKASMDTTTSPIATVPGWQQWGPVGPGGRALPKQSAVIAAAAAIGGPAAAAAVGGASAVPAATEPLATTSQPYYPASPMELPQQVAKLAVSRAANSLATKKREEIVVDLDVWSASGYPPAVSTCVIACCKGIKRAHLLDARQDGGLLLELYSRDGVGTMISADFYEGIRRAHPADLDGVRALLRPLEEAGICVKRSSEEIANMLPDFTVIERETKLMGCALLLPLGQDANGVSVAELGAFCVDPAFRGSGRGDSLLDYVEQDARARGVQRLVLLTTRTADWFEQRDFKWSGAAYASELLPEARRSRVNPARNSQLYVKELEACDETTAEPGKRIGF